jgi:hypothetical protein
VASDRYCAGLGNIPLDEVIEEPGPIDIYDWDTDAHCNGRTTAIVEAPHCSPGTPAADSDRAEMLLAEGLANRATDRFADTVGGPEHRIAAEISGEPLLMRGCEWLCDESPVASSAWDGAWGREVDYPDFDAYAAGAALAMALGEP